MPDREKVNNGLTELKKYLPSTMWEPINDAIALLKEQEAKEVEAEVINEIDRLYRCPSCHISMILRGQPYCHYCGQAVKWE